MSFLIFHISEAYNSYGMIRTNKNTESESVRVKKQYFSIRSETSIQCKMMVKRNISTVMQK